MKKRANKSKLPLHKAILIVIIAVLFTAGITSILYSFHKIIDYKEFNIQLQVTEEKHIGFNLDPGVFNFGKVPQGSTAKRNATIDHKYPQPILVKMEITGNAKELVNVDKNFFILEPNVVKQVQVSAKVPSNQSTGNYSGKLKVYFERP